MWNVKKLTRPDDAPVAMTVLMVVIRGRPVQHASTLANDSVRYESSCSVLELLKDLEKSHPTGENKIEPWVVSPSPRVAAAGKVLTKQPDIR